MGCLSVSLLVLLGAGCVAVGPPPAESLKYDPALLSGERIPGEVPALEQMPAVAIVAADEGMRAYVAAQTGEARLSATRLGLLLQGLIGDGYFGGGYDPHLTLTAAEAFRSRAGNCLSYTNMFIALARAAGIDAVFQIVDVPPTWDTDVGFLIRYAHVNVLLPGVQLERTRRESITVDFNVVQPDPEHARRVVSDAYAAGLFFANHAVDLLRRGEVPAAFAHLRHAIGLEPGNPDLWINLGALYATLGDFDSAIEAYDVGLQIDPRNRAALAGLSRNHANRGDMAAAAAYQTRARNYLETNAYYHLALAQRALAETQYERALEYIDRAIRLERRSPRMHFVKGQIHELLGDHTAAMASYRTALRLGLRNPDQLEHIQRVMDKPSPEVQPRQDLVKRG
jgi:tetratricopeptide (TPR) repeat protein